MVAVNKILNNKVSKTETALSIILLVMLVYGLSTALYYVITNNNSTSAPVHYYSAPIHHIASPVRSRYIDDGYDINNGGPTSAPVNEQLSSRYNETYDNKEVLTDNNYICCMNGCHNCNAESLSCEYKTKENCNAAKGEWCKWTEYYKQDNIQNGAFCTKNIYASSCISDNANKIGPCELSNPLSFKTCIEDSNNVWCDSKK